MCKSQTQTSGFSLSFCFCKLWKKKSRIQKSLLVPDRKNKSTKQKTKDLGSERRVSLLSEGKLASFSKFPLEIYWELTGKKRVLGQKWELIQQDRIDTRNHQRCRKEEGKNKQGRVVKSVGETQRGGRHMGRRKTRNHTNFHWHWLNFLPSSSPPLSLSSVSPSLVFLPLLLSQTCTVLPKLCTQSLRKLTATFPRQIFSLQEIKRPNWFWRINFHPSQEKGSCCWVVSCWFWEAVEYFGLQSANWDVGRP